MHTDDDLSEGLMETDTDIRPTPRLRPSLFGACVLLAVAAGLTASVPVAAGEDHVPPSPAATVIAPAGQFVVETSAVAETIVSPQPAAVPADAVRGEDPPAPPAGDEHLLERHAPNGAVIHLDDDGLLVAPAGAADPDGIRAATCTGDRADYRRVTADRTEVSAQSASSIDEILAIMGCDVTGFRLEVDGRTASAVVGAATRDAEKRLSAAVAELPAGLEVTVVLDEIRHG
jgi:hypothetical protein